MSIKPTNFVEASQKSNDNLRSNTSYHEKLCVDICTRKSHSHCNTMEYRGAGSFNFHAKIPRKFRLQSENPKMWQYTFNSSSHDTSWETSLSKTIQQRPVKTQQLHKSPQQSPVSNIVEIDTNIILDIFRHCQIHSRFINTRRFGQFAVLLEVTCLIGRVFV